MSTWWSAQVKAQLDKALRLCQAGTLPEAERICRDILAHHAHAGDAWNLLAMILHHRGELDEAARAAERAIALQPENPQYLMIRGGIAQAKRCPREAQSCYQRAIDVAPAFAEAHFRLAISYDREQRVADAITSYRNALRHAPDVALIHYHLAEALMLEARWVEAMDSDEAAFRRDNHGEFDRRGSIDCLTHLQFDVIPDFWVTEIARFFARDDIDKLRYASVVLRVLTTREAFRRLLSSPLSPGAIAEFDAAALDEVMRNEHFRIVLCDALVVDAGLESLVTRLRTGFLFDTALRAHAPVDFLCALALQCFNNEFVFAQKAADESARVESFAARNGG